MSGDRVRITGKIEIEYHAFVDQDVYEAWEADDAVASDKVAEVLAFAADQELESSSSADGALVDAWLVEDDGYLGTEIVRLKKF